MSLQCNQLINKLIYGFLVEKGVKMLQDWRATSKAYKESEHIFKSLFLEQYTLCEKYTCWNPVHSIITELFRVFLLHFNVHDMIKIRLNHFWH